MRLQRIMTALIALALMGLATFASPASAQAAPSGERVSAAAQARDLPRRDMNDKVVKNKKGWLIFKGNVDPGWNHKNVKVYKKAGGKWSLFKKVKTDGQGRWSVRIYAPRNGNWFWKGIVPKAGGYGKSVTGIWRTYTI